MPSQRGRVAHGVLLLVLGVGAACFFVSFFILMWLGLATGIEPFEISFAPVPKKPMSWGEIISLLASIGFSIFTAELIFRVYERHNS